MNDHIRNKRFGDGSEPIMIFKHRLSRGEVRALQQHRMSPVLEGNIIVVRYPVIAMHNKTVGEQLPRKMEADETGRASDKNAS